MIWSSNIPLNLMMPVPVPPHSIAAQVSSCDLLHIGRLYLLWPAGGCRRLAVCTDAFVERVWQCKVAKKMNALMMMMRMMMVPFGNFEALDKQTFGVSSWWMQENSLPYGFRDLGLGIPHATLLEVTQGTCVKSWVEQKPSVNTSPTIFVS